MIDREYSNEHDENACLVWLPPLNMFPPDIHDEFTDVRRQLKLRDIAGLPVGHVPKCLSSYFRNVLDKDGHIYAVVTGEPTPSFPPWPAPSADGGGVIIPCKFIIDDAKMEIDEHFKNISELFSKIPEGSVMRVSVGATD